jgi:hypothetical protein
VKPAFAALIVLVHLAVPPWASPHGVIHGFVDDAVTSGLTLPVAFATLPDGRVLIAEKAGVVRVVSGGRLLPDAFIDLRARVNDYWDRGLLGLAADPAFAQNGFVYLFYVHEDDPFTYSGPKTSRLVRVTTRPRTTAARCGSDRMARCGSRPAMRHRSMPSTHARCARCSSTRWPGSSCVWTPPAAA